VRLIIEPRALFPLLGVLLIACGVPESEEPDASSPDPVVDVDGDGRLNPRSQVINASIEVRRALCSNEYRKASLSFDRITRGSWQFNPGGGFKELGESGYPCRAFLYDDTRPAPDDPRWTEAKDRDYIEFQETSTLTKNGFVTAQFRYFRTLVFVPAGKRPTDLIVRAAGIDDALYLAVYNSDHPEGISPLDAGSYDPEVGACTGNGAVEWNIADHLIPGEINQILLVHADMNPVISSLASVEVESDGDSIQMVDCNTN